MAKQFSKSIEYSGGRVVFFFNRIFTVNGDVYHISAKRKGENPNHFIMKLKDDLWHFAENSILPQWIMELEKKLGDIIIQNKLKSQNLS